MAKLVESSQWEEDLYQIETSDPVEGGPDGVSNRQGKQLGGRTRYLKQQVEQSQSGLTQHVAAADPHPQYATKADVAQELGNLVGQAPETLDTINEIAQALGKDPNFATTITNQLALKAPIDSPVFTGTPKGPTPPQFDSSTKLATMAALQRALGSASSMKTVGAPAIIDLTYAGADVVLYGNAGPFTQSLPAVSTYQPGVGMRFYNASAFPVTIQTAGGDKFSALGGTVASIVVGAGDSLAIAAYGTSNWEVMGGSAALQWSSLFSSSVVASGYQKLPSGLIIQWGQSTTNSSGAVTVTFPLTFPNSCLQFVGTPTASSASNYLVTCGTPSASNISVFGTGAGAGSMPVAAGIGFRWIAVGY
ncbi:gp53-like domain-containing protein [Burkholderia sp. AW49-1]